jgi:hypothetical protein
LSADTIVGDPTNPQDLNRFSYTRNNPLRYTDPTGHCPVCILLFLFGTALVVTGDSYDKAVDHSPEENIPGLVLMTGGVSLQTAVSACTSNPGRCSQTVEKILNVAPKASSGNAFSAFNPAWQTAAKSGVTVLGRMKIESVPVGFREVADDLGANALNVPKAISDSASKVQQWAWNKEFLDNAIKRGDVIRLANSHAEQMKFTLKLLADWIDPAKVDT